MKVGHFSLRNGRDPGIKSPVAREIPWELEIVGYGSNNNEQFTSTLEHVFAHTVTQKHTLYVVL